MLILEEDEILNNKLKISLFINYIRSLMLCLDEKIIKEFVDKLPNNDDCFQINLVLKTLKIYPLLSCLLPDSFVTSKIDIFTPTWLPALK